VAHLRRSAGTGRKGRQFTDLLSRHAFTSFRERLRGRELRRGQESNLSRFLRTDNGFEDREGHQAPFTLREEEKENAEPIFAGDGLRRGERSTSSAQGRSTEEKKDELLLSFFNRADDSVEVGPVAGLKFGMKKLAIGANFKSAAA
jgi:hypothetical protein